MERSRYAVGSVLVLALGVGGARELLAQGGGRRWSVEARAEPRFRYDDNPFLLSAGQKPRLEAPAAGDAQSGRYTDMESTSDLVPSLGLELGLEGSGIAGRALALGAGATYEANLQNGRRRHVELGFSAEQALGHGSRLRLALDWRPSYYHKNYLTDAVDADANGDIAAGERRYRAGTSGEVDATLGYRHRLLRSTRERQVGVNAELEAGWFGRSYDAPFAGRSRSGPGGQVGFQVELARRLVVSADYAYQKLDADVTREVMILDETGFGQDFNGNGNTTDLDARAFELVDRSRSEQEIGVGVRGELTDAVTAELSYGRRMRSFSSSQPFDVSNRDRHDTLNELEVALRVRLARSLRLDLGARRAAQNTNRVGDPGSTGEVADYTRLVAWGGLGYRF